MSWSAVRRAWSLGMAKPSPMLPPVAPPVPGTRAMARVDADDLAVMSSSGPPELPGLIAASVWMALMKEDSLPSPGVTGRLSALTMPVVTVWSRPSGAPTAMTWSPTTTLSDAPSVRGFRSVRFDLEHGEVVARVAPDDGRLLGVAVAQHDLDVAV